MGRTVISLIFLFLAFNHYLISPTFTYLDLILLLALSLILEQLFLTCVQKTEDEEMNLKVFMEEDNLGIPGTQQSLIKDGNNSD